MRRLPLYNCAVIFVRGIGVAGVGCVAAVGSFGVNGGAGAGSIFNQLSYNHNEGHIRKLLCPPKSCLLSLEVLKLNDALRRLFLTCRASIDIQYVFCCCFLH